MDFLKKIFQGKWVMLGSKMAHPHNFGSTLRIFCTMKGVKRYKRYTEIILMVFLKNISFRANGPF